MGNRSGYQERKDAEASPSACRGKCDRAWNRREGRRRQKLFLSFKGQGDEVEIIVRDNGTGMEQEKAETLVTYQAKGYGLKNVNDRIRLLYGESYGIQIYSAPGEGTTVIMRFPKEIRNYEE